MRAVTVILIVITVQFTLVSPVPLHAQSCFRGQPPPACKSFWITELGYSYRLNAGGHDHYVTFELGYMSNQSERYALGGSLLAGFDEEFRIGLKPRLRRWLGRSTSIEVSPGILLAGGGARLPGFTGHVGVNFADVAILTSQVEVLDRGFGSNVAWYGGIKLGSKPGLITSAIGSGVLAILAIVYIIHCSSNSCD